MCPLLQGDDDCDDGDGGGDDDGGDSGDGGESPLVMMVVQTSNETPSPFTLCQGGDDCFDVDGDVFLVVIVIGGCGGGDE